MKFLQRRPVRKAKSFFARKADLSLSVNSIVILILAITMLGLGLGFTRFLMSSAQGKIEKIMNQEDLINPPNRDNVITLSPPDPAIKHAKTENLQVAYYNANGKPLCVQVDLVDTATLPGSTRPLIGAVNKVNAQAVGLNQITASKECRLVDKDDISAWKVPLIGLNSNVNNPTPGTNLINVVTVNVNTFTPDTAGKCVTGTVQRCTTANLYNTASKDMVLTIEP